MLRVNLIVVGSLKEKYLRDACEEYVKRLGAFCKISVTELPEVRLGDRPSDKEIDTALGKEAEAILKLVGTADYLIAMCIEGKQISSPEFWEKLESVSLAGKSTVDIVIGSSFGLHSSVKDRADFKLSLSKMTFPHQLARVMVLEQTYRAFSIGANTKYHK